MSSPQELISSGTPTTTGAQSHQAVTKEHDSKSINPDQKLGPVYYNPPELHEGLSLKTAPWRAYYYRPYFGKNVAVRVSSRMDLEYLFKKFQEYFFIYRPPIITSELLRPERPLKLVHNSCNRACAIYCVAAPPCWAMFCTVYKAWLSQDKPSLAFGSFAAQTVGCWRENSPQGADAILENHEAYCTEVKRRLAEAHTEDYAEEATRLSSNFQLLPLFRAVVIVVDKKEWWDEGVLLIRTSDPRGLEQWPLEDAQPMAVRLSLQDAIKAVLKMQRNAETASERTLRLAPLKEMKGDEYDETLKEWKKETYWCPESELLKL